MKNKICFALLLQLLFINIGLASKYPQSQVENEMEEMGSLLQGEGLVFKPGKTKSTATKTEDGKANKYLYKAAIDVLDFAPLALTDDKKGIIITEWYNPKGKLNIQFKINVYIKGNVISTEAVEVKVYERVKNAGKWSAEHKESAIGSILEYEILKKARTLYQSEK